MDLSAIFSDLLQSLWRTKGLSLSHAFKSVDLRLSACRGTLINYMFIVSRRSCFFFFFSLWIFFSPFKDIFAFGVSPVLLELENLTQKNDVLRTLYLSRANPAHVEYVQVKVQGTGAKALVLPSKGLFELSQGKEEMPYEFSIRPLGFPPGKYEAELLFQSASFTKSTPSAVSGDNAEEKKEDAPNILIGAQVNVRFTVISQEIESYHIEDVQALWNDRQKIPIFKIIIVNQGNISTRPARIDIITKEDHIPNNFDEESFEGTELPIILPFERETVVLSPRRVWKPGLYTTQLVFFVGDKPGFTSSDIRLQVPGELPSKPHTFPVLQGKRGFFLIFFVSTCILFAPVLCFLILRYILHDKK